MPLILLQGQETTANLSSGYDVVNELEATTAPMRFGVTAHFSGLANSSGNMELHVKILTTGGLVYGTQVVTAARVALGGTPIRGRVEFEKLFFLPVGFKAQFKIKSVPANDTNVNTQTYVYDPNYPTVDAEFRDSEAPPSQSQAAYASGNAIGTQMTFIVGANRGSIVACRVLDKSRNTVPLELWLFRASTSGGAGLANNSPFDPTDTQLGNLAAVIRIDDWFATATENSIGQATNLPLSFTDLSGSTLYAWLVARGGANYTGTSQLTVQLEVLKD